MKPTVASHIASQYTPGHFPDSHYSGTGQTGLVHIPSGDVKPGQTIPFAGSQGNSPGVIHVVKDSSSPKPFTSGSGLIHIPPGQTPPDSVHVRPHGDTDLPKPFTSGPDFVQVTHNGGSLRPHEVTNEIGSVTAAATIRGNAYLPPDASPTPDTYTPDLVPPYSPNVPSPSAISPNVLIPHRPTTTEKPHYITPKPHKTTYVTYKPTYKPTTTQPTYFYQPTTQKPVYTTPKKEYPRYPQGSSVTNEYLPPDGTSIVSTAIPTIKTYTDSPIININVITPSTDTPLRPEGAGTSETRLRPPGSPKPVTEYPFKGDLNTTPYPGCAAALKCVQPQFCTADAVISDVPVVLSKEQETMRVPTTVSSIILRELIQK